MNSTTIWILVVLVLVAWALGILYGVHLACKQLGADYADLLGGGRRV